MRTGLKPTCARHDMLNAAKFSTKVWIQAACENEQKHTSIQTHKQTLTSSSPLNLNAHQIIRERHNPQTTGRPAVQTRFDSRAADDDDDRATLQECERIGKKRTLAHKHAKNIFVNIEYVSVRVSSVGTKVRPSLTTTLIWPNGYKRLPLLCNRIQIGDPTPPPANFLSTPSLYFAIRSSGHLRKYLSVSINELNPYIVRFVITKNYHYCTTHIKDNSDKLIS